MCHPTDGGLYAIRLGGDGARTRVICGFLACDSVEGNLVISTLPGALRLNVEEGSAAEWIRSTFQYAADEVATGRPGSATVLAKLSELLFVEAVRRYAETLPEGQTGWLAGLRDRYVARALTLFHRDMTRSWTVDELGREVGLSRSALAERFTRLIGMAPMHYLTNWRMQVAAQELRNSSASLARSPTRSATSPRPPFHARSKRPSGRHRPRGDVHRVRPRRRPHCRPSSRSPLSGYLEFYSDADLPPGGWRHGAAPDTGRPWRHRREPRQ